MYICDGSPIPLGLLAVIYRIDIYIIVYKCI